MDRSSSRFFAYDGYPFNDAEELNMLIYPIEWHRRVNKQWLARMARIPFRPFLYQSNENEKCAETKGCLNHVKPTAPIRSRFRPPNLIEHDWVCSSCEKKWTTSIRISS
jgi:hypothetical protein